MRVGFLTAGGIAPCLSASIGHLIKNYSKNVPLGRMANIEESIEPILFLYMSSLFRKYLRF